MGDRISEAQRRALETARDYGHAFARYGMGPRSGGAYSRMCDRLVKRGFLTTAPHRITEAGRATLALKDSANGR